jgi:hypothetical protein
MSVFPTCPVCGRHVYQSNDGYWLGRSFFSWGDPTWRHRDDGTVACAQEVQR